MLDRTRRAGTQPPTPTAPMTMQDVLDAMLLADDRGILLCRDRLPDGAGSAYDHDSGILFIDPRLPVELYCSALVDGIRHVAELDRPDRPALALVVGGAERGASSSGDVRAVG